MRLFRPPSRRHTSGCIASHDTCPKGINAKQVQGDGRRTWSEDIPRLPKPPPRVIAADISSLAELHDEYEFLDADDRYRLLIDLGKALKPMPDALKTDATLVRGCSAAVLVYPTVRADGRLHFLADSNAAITKGIIALVLTAVQDEAPATILATDIAAELAPFDLRNQLSSNRTQGIPNMIALIQATAQRYR